MSRPVTPPRVPAGSRRRRLAAGSAGSLLGLLQLGVDGGGELEVGVDRVEVEEAVRSELARARGGAAGGDQRVRLQPPGPRVGVDLEPRGEAPARLPPAAE